jgi:hypothetical protein
VETTCDRASNPNAFYADAFALSASPSPPTKNKWSISSYPQQKVSHPPALYSPFLLILFTGNQGLRWFPYTGYLGLTPIRVDGGQHPFLALYQCLSHM